jgi:hypothetical protein
MYVLKSTGDAKLVAGTCRPSPSMSRALLSSESSWFSMGRTYYCNSELLDFVTAKIRKIGWAWPS